MLKRIFKSLINQPFKTLLLLAVMFVLSLNLCTAFLIRSAGESTRNDALSGVNPLVAIKSNVCDGIPYMPILLLLKVLKRPKVKLFNIIIF